MRVVSQKFRITSTIYPGWQQSAELHCHESMLKPRKKDINKGFARDEHVSPLALTRLIGRSIRPARESRNTRLCIRRPNNLSCPILSRPSSSVSFRSAAAAARDRNPLAALKLRDWHSENREREIKRRISLRTVAHNDHQDSARDRWNKTGGIVDTRHGATALRNREREPHRRNTRYDVRKYTGARRSRLPRRRSRAPRCVGRPSRALLDAPESKFGDALTLRLAARNRGSIWPIMTRWYFPALRLLRSENSSLYLRNHWIYRDQFSSKRNSLSREK